MPENDRYVDPAELVVVDEFHQGVNEPTVQRITSAGWNARLAGAVTVSRRADGTLAILDGVQRVETARRLGVRVRAVIYDDLDERGEATLFLQLNTSRRG